MSISTSARESSAVPWLTGGSRTSNWRIVASSHPLQNTCASSGSVSMCFTRSPHVYVRTQVDAPSPCRTCTRTWWSIAPVASHWSSHPGKKPTPKMLRVWPVSMVLSTRYLPPATLHTTQVQSSETEASLVPEEFQTSRFTQPLCPSSVSSRVSLLTREECASSSRRSPAPWLLPHLCFSSA